MKIFSILTGLIIVLQSCRSTHGSEANIHFEKEIQSNIAVLNNFDNAQDSLTIGADEIHAEVGRLLLLSKDIENLSASANKANAFFTTMAERYNLSIEFAKLSTGMHVDVIARTLRENELALLNALVFTTGSGTPLLHSAQ